MACIQYFLNFLPLLHLLSDSSLATLGYIVHLSFFPRKGSEPDLPEYPLEPFQQ